MTWSEFKNVIFSALTLIDAPSLMALASVSPSDIA